MWVGKGNPRAFASFPVLEHSAKKYRFPLMNTYFVRHLSLLRHLVGRFLDAWSPFRELRFGSDPLFALDELGLQLRTCALRFSFF